MEGRIPGPDRIATRATMARARFSIGIDLGTTNCALAFVPLDGEAKSEILAIPQWETLSTITESTVLPSFLYPAGGSGGCPDSGRGDRQSAMDCRPARTQKGRGIARPRYALGKVLALSPCGRSLGAISALGIGRDRPRQQGLTGKCLSTHSQSSQASLEQAVCRRRFRV